MFVSGHDAEALHHVFHRDWVGVAEYRLVDFEQLVMDLPRLVQIALPHRFAHARQLAGHQVADRIHQPAGADRHHREAQVFQPDEDAEVHAEPVEALADEAEIIDRMLHADEVGAFFIQINMAFILYFIAHGIHASFIAIKPLIFAVSLGNTAGLLPITPSGIGTRDAVVKSILTAGGFFEGDAVAMPLLFSALILIFSIFGGLFFVLSKRKI